MKGLMGKLMKKKDKNEDGMSVKAKRAVIEELRDMANNMMSGDITEGMKKVTVAAPDQEGLEKGLEKAKELVSSDEMSKDDEEDEDEKKKKR